MRWLEAGKVCVVVIVTYPLSFFVLIRSTAISYLPMQVQTCVYGPLVDIFGESTCKACLETSGFADIEAHFIVMAFKERTGITRIHDDAIW